MNSVNSKIAKNFTKGFLFKNLVMTVLIFAIVAILPVFEVQAWDVDLTRRQVDFQRITNQSRMPASAVESKPVGLIDQILEASGPTQDIVIMNTESGFVPESVSLRQGGSYRIHIVNINEANKNVSFVMDAFSEYHNSLYGKKKTFTINPKTNGVFSYQCPETAMEGKLVVVPDLQRKPASTP